MLDPNRLLALQSVVAVVFLVCTTCGIRADEIILPSNETKVLVNEENLQNAPIVIQTQARDYDEPNLKEYIQCNENRDTCLKVCDTHADRESCTAECPQCPILITHDVAMQGVNDTDFRPSVEKSTNTTNVIKLTNHIHNVIETTHNITAHNDNNVVVHQNISTVGGKYGFGYNDKGPCCMVVRRSSTCAGSGGDSGTQSRRRRSTCPQKRHRLCSAKHCRAPVMRAKPVYHCTLDDNGIEQCDDKAQFEYTPYRQTAERSKCSYTPRWPYVRCAGAQGHLQTNICQRCLRITYGEILQHGIPSVCHRCFPLQPAHMPQPIATNWYPPSAYYDYRPVGYEAPYFPTPDDSWNVEKLKCRFPDGTITDCGPDVTIANEFYNYGGDPRNDFDDLPSANDDDNYNYDYESDNLPADISAAAEEYALPSTDVNDDDAQLLRHRRQMSHIFRASKYSIRHRDEM